LGSPAGEADIVAWRAQHPAVRLPADLENLLRHVDGIHLWANVERGRAYFGIAPLAEWNAARATLGLGEQVEPWLNERHVAISYHQDGAAFVVLDADTGRYFLVDSAGPDKSAPIADNVDQLLDWIWANRIPPDTAKV
jgi:hypothetical protein